MLIRLFNRSTRTIEIENIYGGALMAFLYRSRYGRMLLRVLATRLFSKFLGYLNEISISKYKIKSFVKKYKIDLDEFTNSYNNFNQFFIRKFKENRRPFSKDLPAFCEARYLGGNSLKGTIRVKYNEFDISSLLDHKYIDLFSNGPYLIARLAPVDYHHFHFVDDGVVLDSYSVLGKFHSVNPIAMITNPKILATNERMVTIIETTNFGKIAYIEVGALGVGKIVQTHNPSFKKGEIKGHFLFGGSTVIILGEPNKWKIADDILENSNNSLESYIKLGDTVGISLK